MSQADFVRFLTWVRDDSAALARYDRRNLAQLVFHAKNEGYDFTAAEVAAVVGQLEASVILTKDVDPFDGTSGLWRRMWGARHLDYLVRHVVARHTDAELQSLAGNDLATTQGGR